MSCLFDLSEGHDIFPIRKNKNRHLIRFLRNHLPLHGEGFKAPRFRQMPVGDADHCVPRADVVIGPYGGPPQAPRIGQTTTLPTTLSFRACRGIFSVSMRPQGKILRLRCAPLRMTEERGRLLSDTGTLMRTVGDAGPYAF